MNPLYIAVLVMLVLSMAVALIRVERGPGMLDRAVSVDVITASLIGFVAVFSAMNRNADMIAVIAALALVGFLSTVAVARFMGAETDTDRKILTLEELEELAADDQPLDDDAAPVHDVDALEDAADFAGDGEGSDAPSRFDGAMTGPVERDDHPEGGRDV